MDKKSVLLGDWLVSPDDGTLTRGEEVVHLEPRVMEVLDYLIARPGEVVTREQLERDVWRGALVGDDAVTAAVIKLRKALQDDARQPRFIATIPKKGYKLLAGPRAPGDPDVQPRSSADAARSWSFSRHGRVPATILGAIPLILLLWWLSAQQTPARTPALLVLPLENVTGLAGNDTFADGITEDMITSLSRLSHLRVMSSAVSFKYRGMAVPPRTLHEELNVDYVVNGSIRRQENALRIIIQLTDAAKGHNLWAQRYEGKPDEVFTFRDEIAAKLIEALSIDLSPDEKQHLVQRPTSNLQAYDLFLEGQRISKQGTRKSNQLAAEHYRKAIETDPAFGRAYGGLAFILATDFRRGWTDAPLEALDRALALAEKGVGLNKSLPQTHWSMGYVHLMRKEHDQAVAAALEAVRIAPNYADGYGLLALIYNNMGEAEKAIEYARKGMAINPYYTWDYLFNLGWAHYTLGQSALAVEALEKAQERNEEAVPIKLMLAASYARAGKLEDAEWTIAQLLVLNPTTTLSHTDKAIPVSDPLLKQQLLDDLRQAGLPE